LCKVCIKYGNLYKEQEVALAYVLCCLLAAWLQLQKDKMEFRGMSSDKKYIAINTGV